MGTVGIKSKPLKSSVGFSMKEEFHVHHYRQGDFLLAWKRSLFQAAKTYQGCNFVLHRTAQCAAPQEYVSSATGKAAGTTTGLSSELHLATFLCTPFLTRPNIWRLLLQTAQ
ncbi:hypothetical protein PIB30_101198 [Stylosanthes scabra]|uniref:Uncharacterized protein n=1 Tax=Stylosanthes scabra TaxID=79078 RepID=A0ABU6XY23_9FABA|nr:hypothetical protein [Stylosanthes scabra]